MKLFASALLLAVGGAAAAFEPCGQQAVFDVMMCNSHMCNECALEWCMTSCQDLQMKNPGCRCEAWPETRTCRRATGRQKHSLGCRLAQECVKFHSGVTRHGRDFVTLRGKHCTRVGADSSQARHAVAGISIACLT